MLRPRRRPAGPLRAALRLLLGLGALLACGLASTPVGLLRSAGPLHFALPPGAAGTLGAFHSGQPSQLVVSPPDQPATLHRQTAILTTYQDIRLGSLFGRAPSDPLPGPPGGDTAPDVQLIISPSPNGPCLFSLSSANAGFFRAGQWLLNPIAAGAVALAHTAFESNTAFLLLHWPDSNQLKLATFPNTGMAKVIDLGTAMAGPAPLAAAAGTPLAFLTARGTQVKVFFPTANGQGMANSFATNLPAPVVGSPIITRLRPGDPALALFLLNSGQVASYAIDYNNLSSHGDIYVPDGAAADARLFGASCLELGPNDGGPLFLANPGPDGRLWRLNVDTGGHLAGWTELRLPAGTLAGALRPVLLNTATGPMWTLADSHAYLQADVFGCSTTDPTISCSATEYTCASGSVPSGLLMDGRLCAGCEDGTTASSPWSAAAPCTACMQAGCLVCHDASCLHCPAGTLPQTDMQSGDTVCVSSCAAGYHAAGGRCLPVMPRRPRGLTHPEPRFQGPGGSGAPPMSGARLLAPTCLATANGQLSLLLDPPSGRASDTRLLLFHSDPQHKPAILHANVFSGPPAAGPLFDVHPLDLWPADAPTFTHFLNLLPVEQTSGAPAAALLGCHGHTLHWGKVMCNGPASLAGSCAAYFGTFTDTEAPCYGLRALAPNLAAVLGARSGLRLAMLHPSGGIRMQSLPGYIQPPAVLPLLSHSSAVSDWLLAVGPQQSGFLPLNMALVQDPRLEAAPPALRHMVPDGWVPVALPHKTRSLAEVFLTGLHHDSPPGGETPPAWVVEHVPLSGGEAQWTVAGLSTQEQVLGRLPVDPGPDVHFRVLSTPGDVNVPSALLLLSPRVVGFAQLQCLQLGGCWLRDAWFQVLSADLAFDPALALPLPQNASPSTRVDMLVIRPGIGLATLALEEQCGSDFSDPNPCVPCHPRCATCSGSSPSQCISCSLAAWREPFDCLDYCPEGLVHQGNQCVCHDTCSECQKVPSTERYQCQACQAGWALEPGAHPVRCLQCHDSCSMCTAGEDPAACTACHQGHYLQGSQCLDSCPVGLWPDNLLNRCQPCPEVCLSCTSTTHCTLCRPGFIPAGGQCRLCHSSCLSCTDEVSCSACRPGLVFLDPDPGMPSLCGSTCPPGEFPGPERCTRCDRSCDLCAGGAARCLVCAEGFRWDIAAPGPGKTGACVPCPAGCASCIGTGPGTSRCLSCGAEHFLTQDGTCAGSCPAATFGETTQWTCQPCDVSCGACLGGGADQCTGCAAGLELVEVTSGAGTCVSGCPEGQYRAGADCLPCDAACATCNGPTDKDCWRCASGVLQDGDCVQACAAQYVAVADRCLPCHPSCGSCTGVRSTECTACPGGLLALPAGQTPGRCVPGCPVGHNTAPAGCALCASHCASCPESADTCALCERGLLLAGDACGTECPADAAPQGGICTTCHGTCATCYGPGPDQCLTCSGGSLLLAGTTCLEHCPGGSFPSGPACAPCHGTCATCTGPSGAECTACPPDRALTPGGACLASCPPGEYPAQESGGRVCRACDVACETCTGPGPGHCTSCAPPALLAGGACVDTCPAGHFVCLASRRCEPCPAGCAECQEQGTCQAACTACEAGLLLSGTACMAACPAGHFAPAGSRICEPCDGACNTCTERPDRCTSCAAGFLLPAEGACASACPAGWAPLSTPDRVCLACPAACEECTAASGQAGCTVTDDGSLACPDIGSCSRCAAQFLLLHGASCVGTCPVGMYDGWEASPAACLACRAGCAECTGPEEADCVRSARPSSRGLALGLGIGLGLLMLLLLLVALLVLLWRYRRAAKPGGMAHDDEDATVMNTMLELSLPGSILVSIANDFAPLNEEALGAGTQASVYAARAVGAGISDRLGCPGTVAIKQLKAARMTPTQVTLFQNEVALMWLLRDASNVVRLYGYSEQPPAIVMERYQTDLATLLHSEVPLAPHVLLDMCQQWASGLEAMHAQGIAHRDLKPGNVFVSQRPDGGWRAALGDLGTSRNLNTDRSSTLVSQAPELNAMTARYAAPEVLAAFHRKRPLDCELFLPADIYSAAIMLWECLMRTVPWQGRDFEQISSGVLAGERPAIAFDGPLADLLPLAWDANPHARPPAASLRQKAAMAALSTEMP